MNVVAMDGNMRGVTDPEQAKLGLTKMLAVYPGIICTCHTIVCSLPPRPDMT